MTVTSASASRRMSSAMTRRADHDYFIPIDELRRNVQVEGRSGLAPAMLTSAVAAALSTAATYPLALLVTRLQIQRELKLQRRRRERASAAAAAAAASAPATEQREQQSDEEPASQPDDHHRFSRRSVHFESRYAEGHEHGNDEFAEHDGLLDAARHVYTQEGGLHALYAGYKAACGQAAANAALYVLAYRALESRRRASRRPRATHARDTLLLGLAADCLAKLVTTPLGVVLARQQTAACTSLSAPQHAAADHSASAIAEHVVRENGYAGLWAGYGASCLLAMSPLVAAAVTRGLRAVAAAGNSLQSPQSWQRGPPPRSHTLVSAVADGTGKLCAACLMYPLNVARVRAQIASHRAGGSGRADVSPLATLRSVRQLAAAQGVSGLYAGLAGELVRGVSTHALGVLTAAVVRVVLLWALRRVVSLRKYILRYLVRRGPRTSVAHTYTIASSGKLGDRHVALVTASSSPALARPSHLATLASHTRAMASRLTRGVPRLARSARSALTAVGLGGITSTKAPREMLSRACFMPTPVPPCSVPGHHHLCDCVNEELAELVHDYVEDDAADWRSLYQDHWLLKL